jgi:octaprenyl-diphosphate synthase
MSTPEADTLSQSYRRRAERLAELVAPVLPGLERSEEHLSRYLASPHPFIQRLAKHTEQFRGKRLRPALLLLAGRAFKPGMSPKETAPLACETAALVEMIHLATLCHDDILDDAATRRNAPTVNAQWGNKAAVMTGDMLFARAFEEMGQFNDPRPMRVLSFTSRQICEGELLQVASRFDPNIGEPAYLDLIEKKTGALFGAAGELGATLAGATQEQGERLNQYGRRLGMAFQIVDDCLDLIGVEKTVGKSLGSDLKNGEPTLPLIHILNKAGNAARQKVLDIFKAGNPDLTREKLSPILRESGSIDYAINFAKKEIQGARDCVAFLTTSPAKECLLEVTEYVIARDS